MTAVFWGSFNPIALERTCLIGSDNDDVTAVSLKRKEVVKRN